MDELHYDYTAAKAYCERLGLVWLGDDYIRSADDDAYRHRFTQAQVDAALRHCFGHVKYLFAPDTYTWSQRIGLAWHFLFGRSV